MGPPHCVHTLTSFVFSSGDAHSKQYCCWCDARREPKVYGHEPEPGHGPHLDTIHSRSLWTDPWKDEACPKREGVVTVSQETIDKRTKAVIEKYGPMIAENRRITEELNEHPSHEWGTVADCRLCQEERAKT